MGDSPAACCAAAAAAAHGWVPMCSPGSPLSLCPQGLPYGTMSDDEMRAMGIAQLQDDGVIFMWVTGAHNPESLRSHTALFSSSLAAAF